MSALIDDIPDAYIHEAGCDPWNPPCMTCLVIRLEALILAARWPQPALPVGPDGEERAFVERCRIRGPWPEIERQILAELVDRAWRFDDRTFGFWPAESGRPDELEHETLGGWCARIRVTVEVLDGLPERPDPRAARLPLVDQQQARIAAALALHYPAYNDAPRTPLCPDCKGAPGTHPCGCWSPEEGIQPVCGHCHTGGYRSSSVPWPCPTAVALGAVTP